MVVPTSSRIVATVKEDNVGIKIGRGIADAEGPGCIIPWRLDHQ